MIKLTLAIGDKKQTVQGKTLESAVYKLKPPKKITARGYLILNNNNKRITQLPMNVPRLKRLFGPKEYAKDIMVKNLSYFLK